MVDEEKRSGRDELIELYRGSNPEMGEEINDDILLDFANGRSKEYEEKLKTLNGANDGLRKRIQEDPRAGVLLSMFAKDGTSLPYAMGKVYGREWMDGDLEEFERGYKENLASVAQSKDKLDIAANNIEKSIESIGKYVSDNSIDEAGAKSLTEAIEEFAENLLMGIIPETFVDFIYKGLNYDKDVAIAAETGFVEGKNATIDTKKRQRSAAPIPDMGGAVDAGRRGVGGGDNMPNHKDIYEQFKPIK